MKASYLTTPTRASFTTSHKAIWYGVLLVATALLVPSLRAQRTTPQPDAHRLQAIRARMQQAVDSGYMAGIVTLVTQHGKIIQSSAVGMQDREANLPMREDSIFQLMSMTKPFTAVAMMILVDEGQISLNDEVQKYLPEFRNQKLDVNGTLKAPSRPVRISDLLTHTSGMHHVPQGAMTGIHHLLNHTLAEAVAEYGTEPLQTEPGTHVAYSNMGFATAGRIIEVVSRQPFESFIESRILKPLQMNDTFFIPPADKTKRVAIVYTHKDGKLVAGSPETQGGDPKLFRQGAKYAGPEFALFSTARDLAHFYQMMLDGGTWNGVHILSPAAVETMTQPLTTAALPADRPTDYGISWNVVTKPLGTLAMVPIGSYGHAGAFGTFAILIPQRDIAEIFLTACDGSECDKTVRDVFQQMVAASLPRVK